MVWSVVMLSRSEFLRRRAHAAVLIVVSSATAACFSSSSEGPAAPAPPPEPACVGILRTSSVVAGHTHTVCVPNSDLSAPPPNGATYTTSTDNGHTHSVALSNGQLAGLRAGATVTVQSSTAIDPQSASQHGHAFTLSTTPPPQ
jgi:hypothetical protein